MQVNMMVVVSQEARVGSVPGTEARRDPSPPTLLNRGDRIQGVMAAGQSLVEMKGFFILPVEKGLGQKEK